MSEKKVMVGKGRDKQWKKKNGEGKIGGGEERSARKEYERGGASKRRGEKEPWRRAGRQER